MSCEEDELLPFYEKNYHLFSIIHNLNHRENKGCAESRITKRLIQWVVVNKVQRKLVKTSTHDAETLCETYQNEVRKRKRDVFSVFTKEDVTEEEIIRYEYEGKEYFISIGQLYFFRWLYETGLMHWIGEHREELREEKREMEHAKKMRRTMEHHGYGFYSTQPNNMF